MFESFCTDDLSLNFTIPEKNFLPDTTIDPLAASGRIIRFIRKFRVKRFSVDSNDRWREHFHASPEASDVCLVCSSHAKIGVITYVRAVCFL